MATIGVMIEAQEGLDWPRWRRIVADADRLGFAALRCSDHCLSTTGDERRHSLQAWIAMALAAEWSERVQLGVMVSPITFYVPAVLARMARAVAELADGRLILGVGAGWYQAEHERFGIPFPPVAQRFDNLEAGVARIKHVLDGRPIPLLLGGGGERRALRVVAREAAEWNLIWTDPESYRAKAAALARHCRELGRDPAKIRRSMMVGHLVGRNESELHERARRLGEVLPRFRDMSPGEVLSELRTRGSWLVGTPAEVVERTRPYVAAGVDLFMLQHYLLDDGDALELLASEVLPALR